MRGLSDSVRKVGSEERRFLMSRRKRIKIARRRRPGAPAWEEREFLVVTGRDPDSLWSVSLEVGESVIWIRSNERYFPTVPFSGLENIYGLRDALVEVCKLMGAA